MATVFASEFSVPVPFGGDNGLSEKAVGTTLVHALRSVLRGFDVAVVTASSRGLRAVVQVRNGSAACPRCSAMR